MSVALAPVARQRLFSDLGVVVPNAFLETYATGTATPLFTWADDTGLTANPWPLQASPGGLFPPIYLDTALVYDFVFTTALGVPIYSQPGVSASGSGGGGGGGGSTGLDILQIEVFT